MTGEVTEKSTGVSKTVWRKVLYEDFGVADNYTDNTFLQELRTNINLSPISFKQSITGSLRITTYLSMAEQWLHAQAQEQGWAKATKLQDRSTAQGLIGIAVNKERNVAAMIELNCETDFVARNARFQDLVTTITNHCLTEVMKRQTDRHMFLSLTEEELKGFLAPDGSTLADIIALNIGQIGENMKLRRGVGAFADPSVHMSCYTHPTVTGFCPSVMTGKFGALAFFKRTSEEAMPENWTMDTLGRQICQHIVGMNPSSIERKPDEKQLSPEESTVLLDQEFLVDPDVTVEEVLDACSVNVLDYVRFQCGEKTD